MSPFPMHSNHCRGSHELTIASAATTRHHREITARYFGTSSLPTPSTYANFLGRPRMSFLLKQSIRIHDLTHRLPFLPLRPSHASPQAPRKREGTPAHYTVHPGSRSHSPLSEIAQRSGPTLAPAQQHPPSRRSAGESPCQYLLTTRNFGSRTWTPPLRSRRSLPPLTMAARAGARLIILSNRY